jgi:OPA family glycerol-3-phosphate transporter-like MFS transporter
MISLGLVLCGISNICFGLFPPFAAILFLWGVNAFAQSMLWGAILRILSTIYPESIAKKRASYMATTVAAGNLVGILLNTGLINRFGTAWAFLVPGGITLVMSLLVAVNTNHVQPPVAEKTTHGFSLLLKKQEVRKMLLPALFHGVMKDNISLWMTVYIMDSFGVDLQQSSGYVLLIPTVGFFARILAPELYRMVKEQDKPFLMWGFVFSAAGALLLVFCAYSTWLAIAYLSLIYTAVSVMNGCFLSFFPMRFAKEGYVASVSGIMDFATYLGTGISAAIFGVMIDAFGYGSMFATWAVICFGGLLLLSRSRERAE